MVSMNGQMDTVDLISDVHANFEALQAVLSDMPAGEAVVCAGDVVEYGPSPERCLEEIRGREIPTVVGNHDRAVAEGWNCGSGDKYAQHVLTEGQREWLADLPRERTFHEGP